MEENLIHLNDGKCIYCNQKGVAPSGYRKNFCSDDCYDDFHIPKNGIRIFFSICLGAIGLGIYLWMNLLQWILK